MKLEIEFKFNVGDMVFVALRPSEVSFNDALPIVEMEIEGYQVQGKHYSNDESNIDIIYILREKNGFAVAHERENQIYKTKEQAYSKAISLVGKARSKARDNLRDCDLMLKSHNNTTVN